MSYKKIQLLVPPVSGWTPNFDSIYIIKTDPSKVYVHVPGSQRMAYAFIPNSLQLQLSLADDITLFPDIPSGARGVVVEFSTLVSPYAVNITDTLSNTSYEMTFHDSHDTDDSIVNSVSVNAQSMCHMLRRRIDALHPSYLWTFNNRFVTNMGMYYVDEIKHTRMAVTDALVGYPSAWGDTASRAFDGVLDSSGSVTIYHPANLDFYTFGVAIALTGDDVILTIGNITLAVVGGILQLTIGGATYVIAPLTLGITPYVPANPIVTTAVSPSNWIMVSVNQETFHVIVNDQLATTFTIPTSINSQLPAITDIVIPLGVERRMYSGLFVIPTYVLPSDLVCQTLVPLDIEPTLTESRGDTCTAYTTRVVSLEKPNGTEQLVLPTSGQQGAIIIELFAFTDSQVVVSHVNSNTVTTVRWVDVTQNKPLSIRYWIEEGDTILVTTMRGTVTARTLVIGEH